MLADHGRVDRGADMAFEDRVIVGPVDSMELPVLEVAQAWREASSQEGKKAENMTGGARSWMLWRSDAGVHQLV